jgi:ribonuclease R
MTPSGFGLVKSGDETIFVAAGGLGDALDGDEVDVAITSRGGRGPRGRVERVLARAPRRLCGVVDAAGRFIPDQACYVRPLRFAGDVPESEDGPIVCGAELLTELSSGAPEVRLERSFGLRGDPQAEEDALLWREGMDDVLPAAALAEAERQARAVYDERDPQRLDWRALDFITIDPATAEDHDDALFAEPHPDGGVRAYVAIADVSAFVRLGGALDADARRRSSSLYLPGRVVPMLPPVISNAAASLVPGVDRAAMVLEVHLGDDAQIRARRVVLALIRSRAKLTYDDASVVIESVGASGPADAKAHAATILLLDELAQRLRTGRRSRGAIAVESRETVIRVDDLTGLPLEISEAAHDPWVSRAHQLVEELMLLANETVAGMLREQGVEVLFRTHEAPTEARAAQVAEVAQRRGVHLDASVALDAKALRARLREIPDAALRDELSAAFLETMPSALYAATRGDHFALASQHYVHFTSPIRRYADLTIHRAIRRILTGDSSASGEVDAEDVNRGQMRARSIQREVGDLYAALLMEDRGGERYSGTLVRVTNGQWVVALDEPSVRVRCRPAEAPLEEGARVEVRIEGVSIAARTVEATFLTELAN